MRLTVKSSSKVGGMSLAQISVLIIENNKGAGRNINYLHKILLFTNILPKCLLNCH